MKCASCGSEASNGSRYCTACGARIAVACASCGHANSPAARFCAQCGAALASSSTERRQLTVMFCDLVGSTALAARLDPEDLREIMSAWQTTVTSMVQEVGGFVARWLGDGVLVYFGWPTADEADAERAVRAALQVVDSAAQFNTAGQELQVRIGIATGLAVVGDLIGIGAAREQDVIGEMPNRAARLQGLAEPGSVVIDALTFSQIGALFHCHCLGPVTLKGLPAPVPAWRVDGDAAAPSRFAALRSAQSPLVGRDSELEALLGFWRQARGAAGGTVLITGEAGIGKSRLIAALEERLVVERPRVLRFACSPLDQGTVLHPVMAALRHEAGFRRSDSDADRRRKLRSALGAFIVSGHDFALLADLLSVPLDERASILDASWKARQQATFAALIRWVRALVQDGPALLVLEDAHWTDPSTGELFAAIVEQLPGLPALLIVSARPEFEPAWARGPAVRTMILSRLDPKDSAALAASVSTAKLRPDLLDRIVVQTDGIPLFIEELTKAVAEVPGAAGAQAPLPVPSTLQSSLLARLDRIPAAKEVAQIGSVFGREFSYALLTAMDQMPEPALRRGLAQLVHAGLAFGRNVVPETVYSFKHALVRDTAYGMLLRDRRRVLHARAAAVLEAQRPELRQEQPELLAHHYTQAGLPEPAIGYWTSAGRRSAGRSAPLEAVTQLRQGLRLLPSVPETSRRARLELDLQSALGGALFGLHGWAGGEALQAYERAQVLAQQIGDPATLKLVLAGQFTHHIGECRYRDALRIGTDLLGLGEETGAVLDRMVGNRCMGGILHWMGDFERARGYFDEVLSLYDPAAHHHLAAVVGFDFGIQAAVLSAWDLVILGRADDAAARFEWCMTHSRGVHHQPSRALALVYGAIFNLLRSSDETGRRLCEDAIALATDKGLPNWLGLAHIVLGSILAKQGDAAAGLAMAEQGFREYAATSQSYATTGLVLNMTYYHGLLADACEAAGRPTAARDHLDAAIDAARRSGERWFESELHRMLGDWLLRHAPEARDETEAHLRTAIELAKEQSATLWESRASASLARLHDTSGAKGPPPG